MRIQVKQENLHLFIFLLPALLESSWKSLLAHIVSARRLSTGRILYLYTLSQCLSRCKQGSGPLPGGQDPLPVWEVWVGAALSAMVNLMGTPTAKGKRHNAEVVGQLLEQVTHVVQVRELKVNTMLTQVLQTLTV